MLNKVLPAIEVNLAWFLDEQFRLTEGGDCMNVS